MLRKIICGIGIGLGIGINITQAGNLNLSQFSTLDFQYAIQSGVAIYIKGINDSLDFLEKEVDIKLPQKPYWLVIDVSKLPFWRVVVLSNYFRDKLGFYPAYVYNVQTGQRFLIPYQAENPKSLKPLKKQYDKFYPNTRAYIIEALDLSSFVPVVQLRTCSIPNEVHSELSVIQTLEIAKGIAESNNDNTLAKYLSKVIKQVKAYLQTKGENF